MQTYCTNTQVADSACTATAYLGGVKTNYGTIGVSAAVEPNDCLSQNNTLHHVTSIAAWAQKQGMATGLVTTTSVTHASPAGVYAHTANRNWENDAEVLSDNGDPHICTDIATQLVHGEVGRKLNVILGGGRKHFLPNTVRELEGELGQRLDGHNLINEWLTMHGNDAHYAQTRDELLNVSTAARLERNNKTNKCLLTLFTVTRFDQTRHGSLWRQSHAFPFGCGCQADAHTR